MNIDTLHQYLTQTGVVLSLSEEHKLKYKAPKGTMTPDIIEAMKEHKAALLAALPDNTKSVTNVTAKGISTEQRTPLTALDLSARENLAQLRARRLDPFRPSKDELTIWASYYDACPWYQNPQNDGPWGIALEYGTCGDIHACLTLSTSKCIRFYEQCAARHLQTESGVELIDPRQYTERLRTAYESQNMTALAALAANFERESGTTVSHAKRFLHITDTVEIVPPHAQTNVTSMSLSQSQNELNNEPAPQKTIQKSAASSSQEPSRKGKGRAIVYADIHMGKAITDTGDSIFFPASYCSLSDVLDAIYDAHTCDRLYICGQLPTDYASWLIDPKMWENYTTGKRGHYFDKEKDENHVARYARRASGDEIEVRTMFSWFGDADYSVEEARVAMALLNQYLQATFTPTSIAYATPALTFQQLWTTANRIEGKKFQVLPEEIRTKIHGSTGQGRIELCTPSTLDTVNGLYYYDGIFMYAALAWGMPTEIALHDTENIYAGKVPARYRIRYTVPADWHHLGLFMTPKEQVTGNSRDSDAWCYPGENYQGRTFECWADGAELDVAYNLPDGIPTWTIEILERIVYKSEKESAVKKALDGITNKLDRVREKVTQDARQDSARAAIYKLVRGAMRNILLHGIGSFHRNVRDVTYVMRIDEPAPDDYTGRREVEGTGLVWYTVPQKTEAYTQQFEHPEWTALIWARCRARMTRAALGLPRKAIVAIRTDAIATSEEQPQWTESEKRGSLRLKWSMERKMKAPHDFTSLDTLVHKYAKGA